MMRIEAFEKAIENKVRDIRAEGINGTMFWAYRDSLEAGNETIDFAESIWDEDIEAIVETCRANGIKEFTISSRLSSMATVIWGFEQLGCHLAGMRMVNGRFKDTVTNKQEQKPAFVISL